MRRESLQDLPDTEVPDGFDLRTFRGGDEAGWATLMNGAIGDWDEQSTAKEFLSDPGVQADGIFFLLTSGLYIATATDKRVPQPGLGYLHMVAVAPSFRGQRLGRSISLAALHRMRERGCQQAILDTDDFRLPAIRTYFGLGFVPDNVEADHAERWREIDAKLRAAQRR
jgi:ribosomal protein S18 acetylase RimI-like enzyme